MATSSKPDFEIIRRNKVYEEVAKQIERLILKKLKPGDKLPAERELAEMLGVSRGSIRDAIRGLELLGLVEPRQGAGTIVRHAGAHSAANPFANALKRRKDSVIELLDFRKILEPPLAARAATHASPEETAEMEAILKRQEEKHGRGVAAVAEDAEFHYSVALASGNTVVLKVIDILMGNSCVRRARARCRSWGARINLLTATAASFLPSSVMTPMLRDQLCCATSKMWKISFWKNSNSASTLFDYSILALTV